MGRVCLCICVFFFLFLSLAGCTGSTCEDTCEQAGAGRCGQDGLQLCLQADGCLLWSEPLACAPDEVCADGRCSLEPCDDACEQVGQGRCTDGGLQLCLDADGCRVWSEPMACEPGSHCEDGRCAADTCQDECDGWLATRCAGEDSLQVCVELDGCLRWADPQACEAGQTCLDGRCQGCDGAPGTYSDQALTVEGEQRAYFLHVPDEYECEAAWPLVIHLHGTVGDYPRPEEAYGLEAMVALADAEGFILVRPRSRSRDWGGSQVYQWDINPGDLERNAAFVQALVDELQSDYHLDPARTYVTGFSNGTNMAVEVLATLAVRPSGVGLIGGGFWSGRALPDLTQEPPRIYAVTGFRDYMYDNLRPLLAALSDAGLPPDRLRQRLVDSGHEMYAWHLKEIWDWLDRGEAPDPGELLPPWTADAAFPDDASLLEVELALDGGLVVAGEGGALWVRPEAGAWTEATGLTDLPGGGAPNLTGLCLLPTGEGLVVGEGSLAATTDFGLTWTQLDRLPDYQQSGFGFAYVMGLGCGAGTEAFTGGYWAAAWTGDMGLSWGAGSAPTQYGTDALIADAAYGDDGSVVAVGYPDYIGRSEDGQVFTARTSPRYDSWYNGVAAAPGGRYWVVGDSGAILSSADGGLTWADQSVEPSADLYAVAFFDVQIGLAVGSHGAAWLTEDGGQTWQDVATGLDGFLGDVVWVDAQTAVAVGQGGGVLTFSR